MHAARQELVKCGQPSCPEVIRNDCIRWLAEVEAAQPSVVLAARDPAGGDLVEVRVLVDGEELTQRLDGLALSVEPGQHVFRYETAGFPAVEQQVVIREGEKRRGLSVQFKSPPAPAPSQSQVTPESTAPEPVPARSVLPYVFGGVGVAALGAFAYLGLTGRAEASDLESGCGATRTCSESQVDPVRTRLLFADVSLGISVVSLGLATWLYLSEDAAHPSPDGRAPGTTRRHNELPATVNVGASSRGGFLELRGRF